MHHLIILWGMHPIVGDGSRGRMVLMPWLRHANAAPTWRGPTCSLGQVRSADRWSRAAEWCALHVACMSISRRCVGRVGFLCMCGLWFNSVPGMAHRTTCQVARALCWSGCGMPGTPGSGRNQASSVWGQLVDEVFVLRHQQKHGSSEGGGEDAWAAAGGTIGVVRTRRGHQGDCARTECTAVSSPFPPRAAQWDVLRLRRRRSASAEGFGLKTATNKWVARISPCGILPNPTCGPRDACNDGSRSREKCGSSPLRASESTGAATVPLQCALST